MITAARPLTSPEFGSYAPDDVTWLLTDLSDVELEAPVEEREEAIQSGRGHYAESLPIEYQPSEEYVDLYRRALAISTGRLAAAVGVLTETVLAERGARPVLVSLARAGVPVGVLMKRYAAERRGIHLPHYAVSIVRGRGIDTAALDFITAAHPEGDLVFVDGWTGKGAISRELAAALDDYAASTGRRLNPDLAVLADPGHTTRTYGTREDFLIPSACLNSTVSGLVSRTVLNDLIQPGMFHGAKFYRDLAAGDVSREFVDAVAGRFADHVVVSRVERELDDRAARDFTAEREPDWSGWADVERISAAYDINDVNLVKPGVGETTRVLLRRVPWRILFDPERREHLVHVFHLAEQRGVELEAVEGLTYSCVGLIHPKYTRGATGFDGKAAR